MHAAESENKLKHNTACEAKHASLAPLSITIDGLIGDEKKHFLSRLADRLASKWDQQYRLTLHWIRTKLSLALICATSNVSGDQDLGGGK